MKHFYLFYLLLFLAPVDADAEVMMTDLMRESDYQKNKKQAAVIHQFSGDVGLLDGADNINNFRKPNAQADTLKMVELWEQDIERFCSGPIQRFINTKAEVNVNNADALEAMNVFEEDFKLSDISKTCERIKRELNTLLQDPYQMQREMPRFLASYKETIDRAGQSKVTLRNAFADTSSSIFSTQMSLKAQINTLIGIRELVLNDSMTKEWRSQFNAMHKSQSNLIQAQADEIAEKFKKPTDLFKADNGETLKQRIVELLDTQKTVEIILADNNIRKQKRLVSITRGMEYESISFYAFYPEGDEMRLDYGWYEKNLDNNNDAIHFSERLIFPVSEATQVASAEPTAAPVTNDSKPTQITTQTKAPQAATISVEQGGGFGHLMWWVLGLIQALLMLALGLQLIHAHPSDAIPEKLTAPVQPLLNMISPLKSPLALALLAVAVMSLISAITSPSLMGIGIAAIAVCCALLCISTAPVPNLIKPLKPFASWIGIASVVLGLIALIRLLL